MLTTRVDPGLRLSHLRPRDQLTEFCTTDLPFTPTETTAFFNYWGWIYPPLMLLPLKTIPGAGLPGCNWSPF